MYQTLFKYSSYCLQMMREPYTSKSILKKYINKVYCLWTTDINEINRNKQTLRFLYIFSKFNKRMELITFTLPDLPECTTLCCEPNTVMSLPDLPKCKILKLSQKQCYDSYPIKYHTPIKISLPGCREVYCSNIAVEIICLSSCIELYCTRCKLTSLPNLPNCEILECSYNNLTVLPELPNCEILYCISNRLTSLPDLPNCEMLECSNNNLTVLPDLPNCEILCCSNNKLTSLPDLLNCKEVVCGPSLKDHLKDKSSLYPGCWITYKI